MASLLIPMSQFPRGTVFNVVPEEQCPRFIADRDLADARHASDWLGVGTTAGAKRHRMGSTDTDVHA